MYVIRVALRVREDAREEFERQASDEAAEVPARFAGCIRYGFFESVDHRCAFLLYEEWANRESFEAYRGSAYFAEVGGRLRPLLATPPDSAYFEAERTT